MTANPSRGRLLFLARAAAWLVVPFYVACIAASFWLESRLGLKTSTQEITLSVGFGMFAVVGALLGVKRPENPIGWILVCVSLAVPFNAGDFYTAYVIKTLHRPDALAVFGAWLQSWYWYLVLALAFVYLPLLFPDGRLPSRRWLPVALVAGLGTAGMVVLGALTDTLTGQHVHYHVENPIGIEGLAPVEKLPVFGALGFCVLVVGVLGAFASVAARFRRSRGIERQQLKWLLYAAAFASTLPLQSYAPEVVGSAMFGFVLVALPLSIGVAVLKHRLYDIDLVINRTLVYGSLTVSLAAVYFGGVVTLQHAFRAVSGEKSQLAVVASTLLIAALFQPLRRRVQNLVDRRFYRSRYDARKVLETFSEHLKEESDLDALGEGLISVVRETVQPSGASLWLRPTRDEK